MLKNATSGLGKAGLKKLRENPSLPLVEAGFSRASCRKENAGLKAAATKSARAMGFYTDSEAPPFQSASQQFFSSLLV